MVPRSEWRAGLPGLAFYILPVPLPSCSDSMITKVLAASACGKDPAPAVLPARVLTCSWPTPLGGQAGLPAPSLPLSPHHHPFSNSLLHVTSNCELMAIMLTCTKPPRTRHPGEDHRCCNISLTVSLGDTVVTIPIWGPQRLRFIT